MLRCTSTRESWMPKLNEEKWHQWVSLFSAFNLSDCVSHPCCDFPPILRELGDLPPSTKREPCVNKTSARLAKSSHPTDPVPRGRSNNIMGMSPNAFHALSSPICITLWALQGLTPPPPMLDMLMSTTSGVQGPIQFHGSDISANEAVRVGWTALRAVLRDVEVGHAVAVLQLVEEPGFLGNPAWSPHSVASTNAFLSNVRGMHGWQSLKHYSCVDSVASGTFEWIPPVTRDQAPEVLGTVGSSHSSRLICEALPNVERRRRLLLGTSLGGDRLRPALFFEFGHLDFGQFRLRPIRLRPISTSANFDFGQFRPISTSANFDFGQFRLRTSRLRPVRSRIGRSRASSHHFQCRIHDSHDWHPLHLRVLQRRENLLCVSPRLHPIHGPGLIVECPPLIVGPICVTVVGQLTDPFARDNFHLT